jgi:hypothetical protein
LNGDGVLCVVDGLTRRDACRIAGIAEPAYVTLADDVDVRAKIVSLNNTRRHMSEGARTMMVAVAYPEPKRGMHSQRNNSAGTPIDSGRLSKARAVFRESTELVDAVVQGTMTLEEAHKQCRERESFRTESAEPERADLDAYIADVNLERRDLSQGQKAMLLALKRPKQQGKRLATSSVSEEVSAPRISAARTVRELCPEMVQQVIDGPLGLDEALKEAQRRRAANVRLVAERRYGELLKVLARAETASGGDVKSAPRRGEPIRPSPYARALADTGVSTQAASRYQALATTMKTPGA